MFVSLLLLMAGCNVLPFDAVSISPIYGWVDGCNTVTISGHGFSDQATATIGGQAVTDITLPTRELDKGYLFTATVPAGSAAGYADVVVTDGASTDTITGSGAYYYVACPAVAYVEGIDVTTGLAAGTTVTIAGCGFDTSALRGQLLDAKGATVGKPFDLTSVCGTATVSFAAPDAADGSYYLAFVDGSGTVVAGTPCPPADTGDTAAAACADYPLTYGSAR